MSTSKLLIFFFTILLAILIALASTVLWAWSRTIDYSSEALNESFGETRDLLSQMADSQAEFLRLVNASAHNLATIVAASVKGNMSSFHVIEKQFVRLELKSGVKNRGGLSAVIQQVAPALFIAYSTIPYVSRSSYIGKDGLLFSYYRDSNQTRVLFSNTSIENMTHDNAIDRSSEYRLYGESADRFTGCLQGNQVDLSDLLPLHSEWMHKLLLQNGMSVMIEPRFIGNKESSLLFAAPVIDHGMISLELPADRFVKHYVSDIDSSIYFATEDGLILSQIGSSLTYVSDGHHFVLQEALSCKRDSKNNRSSLAANSINLNVNGTLYAIHCTPIEITTNSLSLVLLLVSPCKDIIRRGHEMGILVLIVLASMLLITGLVNSAMYHLSRIYRKRTSFLHASLIKCKEDVQQAERKSMNKSLAFASANHDVRTSLAGITGLIELCRSHVPPGHELHRCLEQMNTCSSKLLGIINSVLDMSKVEAGKMQLEEVEFDVTKAIEESMDIFQVVAMKKGLELIWDPCDFSIFRSPNVRGDCQRFKQILDNLLGNAMKFTAKGHVILRAWTRSSNLHSTTVNSGNGCLISGIWSPLTKLFDEGGSIYHEACSPDNNPDRIELIFEVDDSGIGIPKEKRSFIFENYIQVKESTSSRYEAGTGLGLGIVQSFVRLMGGEINILDKDMNEKGTCFRFNIFLKGGGLKIDIERDRFPSYHVLLGELHRLTVVHFIRGIETRKILQRWMENFGATVLEVDRVELLKLALERIKIAHGLDHASHCVSIEEDVDGIDRNSFLRRTSSKVSRTRVLIIVDVSHHLPSDVLSILISFTKGDNKDCFKIVWLRDLETPPTSIRWLERDDVPCDLILEKPLHGSRIYKLLMLMQEPNTMRLLPRDGYQEDRSRDMVVGDKPLTGWNILVVEDESILGRLARKIVSNLGANCQLAGNGEVALDIVREALKELVVDGKKIEGQMQRTSKCFFYDLILMDCQMPKMNGYECTKRIRHEEKRYSIRIPIVALSADEAREKGNMSIEAGMDLHVTKPLSRELLLDVIRKLNITKNT